MKLSKAFRLEPERHSAPTSEASNAKDSIVGFERAVRVHRAHVEPFTIQRDEDDQTTFHVTGASGGTYLVDRVAWDCSCPDYLHGRLGACKHVEALRRALSTSANKKSVGKRKRKSAVTSEPFAFGSASSPDEEQLDRPVLYASSSEALRLAIIGPRANELIEALGATIVGENTIEGVPHDGVHLVRAGLVHGARITHAAEVAARVLDERRLRAARAEAIDEAVDVDHVLTAPLYPYQRDGVRHLLRRGRAVLADDMGLGKTVQTIAACEILRERGEAKRILIVCPASLKAQWASEIARYAVSGANAVVIAGTAAERRAAFESDAPYIILNYELTWRDLSILTDLNADVLVLDEAQRARNFRTKTAATLKRIPSRFLFVLTGTPVENRLDDLYGILQLIDVDILGPLWRFNHDHYTRERGTGRLLGYTNLAELRERIRPVILRRRKEEVLLQLPELTQQTRYIALSDEQIELEGSYRRTASRLAKISEKRALSPDERLMLTKALLKARQACNGAILCDAQSNQRVPPKIEELAAIVSEVNEQGGPQASGGGAKILVFSEWTEMLKLAAARLDELGLGHLTLSGDVPVNKRQALIDRFRSEGDIVVLLSTDAGGVGLNLQVASYVVHLDLPWNPAKLDQRTSRAHRLGQTRGVLVTYLCAETGIERGIESTLAAKRAIRSGALDSDSTTTDLVVPSFSKFVREATAIEEEEQEKGVVAPPEQADKHVARARYQRSVDVVERSVTTEANLRGLGRSPNEKDVEAFVQQRLRLAQVVMNAGFPGDAVRASYEALSASLRAQLVAGEDHEALMSTVHNHVVAGDIEALVSDLLASVYDLSRTAEQGSDVDREVAERVVRDIHEWLIQR